MKLADLIAFAAKPSRDESAAILRKQIAAIDVDAMMRATDALAADRRRVLLIATDAELEKLEAGIIASERNAERAEAARAELQHRLAEAEARETREASQAKRDEAGRLTDAAIAAMTELPSLYARIRRTVRMMEDARLACDSVNIGVQHEDRVQSPEDWRNAARNAPAVELKRSEVSLWAPAGSPENPLDDATQHLVVSRDNVTGYVPNTRTYAAGIPSGPGLAVVLRRYRRVERLRAVEGQWLDGFAEALRLPPIATGHPAGWDPPHYGDGGADGVRTLSVVEALDMLDATTMKPPKDERRRETVFELITMPVAAEAA